MARMARVVVPHFPHHVTQRGNRRQRTFFRDDDYALYLELMSAYCGKAATRVWAYCLMPNHVHLVMVPSHEHGLRAALGEAHRRYTLRVNAREGWRGHLWQGRFDSFPMDEQHLLAAVRYVERNPVAAGLCRRPEDWKWSSAAAHLHAYDGGLTEVAPMLELAGDWERYLAGSDDGDIGKKLARSSRTGRPLGGEQFVATLEHLTGRVLRRGRPGPKKKVP